MAGTEKVPGTGLRPVPSAFLVGVGVAFAACCLLGFLGSRRPLFRNFTRFHAWIAPESLFYPTASQVRELGRERLDPRKVAVIVGGSSVFYGVRNRVGHVWTERLQKLLGDDYQVLHLSMRGAGSYEFGGVAAEMLLPDHPKLIYVATAEPGRVTAWPDGCMYRYLFWDAYCKGMLPDDPARKQALAPVEAEWGQSTAGLEMKRRMRLDSVLYFNDLWHRVTYEHVSTVWNRCLPYPFWRPRKVFPDHEGGDTPMERRYLPEQDEDEMRRVRSWVALAADLLGKTEPGPDGTTLERSAKISFLPYLRSHTLLVVVRESPYFRDKLRPEEQVDYERMLGRTVEVLRACGFHAGDAGKGLRAEDYNDRCHLSESGAACLADTVAPYVRDAAVKLGYVPAAEVR